MDPEGRLVDYRRDFGSKVDLLSDGYIEQNCAALGSSQFDCVEAFLGILAAEFGNEAPQAVSK